MKRRTKAPNFSLTKELNENTKFWSGRTGHWQVNMMLTLRSIQFCHANNNQVIMQCCSYN